MSEHHTYIAIDLKSFYASVECTERQLNPLTTHLVVAETDRENHLPCCLPFLEGLRHSRKGKAV